MTYEEYIKDNLINSVYIDDDPSKGFIEYLEEPHYSDDYVKYISDNMVNHINITAARVEYELDQINNKLKYDRIKKLNKLKQISEYENN